MARELCNLRSMEDELMDEFYPHNSSLRCDGSKVAVYPSTRGIVLGFLSSIEKSYLGIPLSQQVPRSEDPAEEDAMAVKLFQVGARWWPDHRLYAKHINRIRGDPMEPDGMQEPYGYHFPPRIHVGYPTTSAAGGSTGGAVWVIKITEDDERVRPYAPQVDPDDPLPDTPPLSKVPDDWGYRMGRAENMDERCQVIKDHKGKWYASAEECPDLPSTLEEGVGRGRKYEKFLHQMDNAIYLDRWWDLIGRREKEMKLADGRRY
ncbi:hypothetical protein DL764_007738 [Monosporascus ibericus]|uniref:Uncharacterized protein n=1 Tax=Monosporascus ibericus TaxID=155417 RepID=A0A4Q4T2E7_9PEZI|nr:hypothetical protein DL764_007738 [Monosporascus ibericus]